MTAKQEIIIKRLMHLTDYVTIAKLLNMTPLRVLLAIQAAK